MPTSLSVPKYPFDSLGTNPANRIIKERHTITPKNGYDFHYIVPDYAPFFTNDFKLYTLTALGARKDLVEGVDYVFGFRFLQAVTSVGQPVYGAVSFINRSYAGDVYLEYRTLGGDWLIDLNLIEQIIADWQHNPIVTTWEQVANIPYQFPPSLHTHPVDKLTTVEDLIEEIRKLSLNNEIVINNKIEQILARELAKLDKNSVGLGNLQNLPILPVGKGNDNSDMYYTTPRGVRDIINYYIKPTLDEHINATGNVHKMKASDINAYDKNEVNALLNSKLNVTARAADTTLVMGKSLEELKQYILNGTAANTVKFNNLSYAEVMEDVMNRIEGSIQDIKDTLGDQLQDLLDDAYVSDSERFGGKTVEEYAIWLLENHTIDADKFGGKTSDEFLTMVKNDLSQTLVTEVLNTITANPTLDAKTLTGSTKEQIIEAGRQAKTLEGKTLQEIKNEIIIEMDGGNATTLEGKTLQEIKDEIGSSLVNVNASTLDGFSLVDILQQAYDQGTANADKFNNLTYDELIDQLTGFVLDEAGAIFVGMGTGVNQSEIDDNSVGGFVSLGKSAVAPTARTEMTIDDVNMGSIYTVRVVNTGTGWVNTPGTYSLPVAGKIFSIAEQGFYSFPMGSAYQLTDLPIDGSGNSMTTYHLQVTEFLKDGGNFSIWNLQYRLTNDENEEWLATANGSTSPTSSSWVKQVSDSETSIYNAIGDKIKTINGSAGSGVVVTSTNSNTGTGLAKTTSNALSVSLSYANLNGSTSGVNQTQFPVGNVTLSAEFAKYTLNTVTITAGNGLTGGGNLTANRSLALDYATQAEAEAGTSAVKAMTPQRTAQAIDKKLSTFQAGLTQAQVIALIKSEMLDANGKVKEELMSPAKWQ